MTNLEFADFLGLAVKEDTLVGEKKGYYFSVSKVQIGYISPLALIFVFNNSLNNTVIKQVRKQVKSGVLLQTFNKKNDSLAITFPLKNLKYKDDTKFKEECLRILNASVEVFKELNLLQDNKCLICQQHSEDELDLTKKVFNNFYVPVHNQCVEKLANETIKEVEAENANTGRIGISILFAVLGSIAGLIPTIITAFALGYIYAFLFALIPLGGFMGYKLGKAPKKNYMTIIIIILSVLVVVGFELGYYAYIAKLSEAAFIDIFIVETNLEMFLSDLGQALLFLGIGIWISWKFISNTSDKKLKMIQKLKK